MSSFLAQQNITLLVPSSEAVAKMSPDDRMFWTKTGNLATLVRSGLFFLLFSQMAVKFLKPSVLCHDQKSHYPRSLSSVQPQQHIGCDLVSGDQTSRFKTQ